MKYWLNLLLLSGVFPVFSQTAPVHVYQTDVYHFLDELNTAGVTNENYIAKPYSAKQVSDILFAINSDSLNNGVLKNRLAFYQNQFAIEHQTEYEPSPFAKEILKSTSRPKGLDIIYFGKDKIAITMNPIIGLETFTNFKGTEVRRRVGGSFKMYIDRFTLYGSVRDVYETSPFTTYNTLDPHEGSLYKHNSDGTVEFSESRGGVSYNLGWGEIAFAKDHLKWGHGSFGTNILDANVPSYPHLKFRAYPKPWIKFEYIHASLQSNVIDSTTLTNVAGIQRADFHNKFLASNLLSLRLKKKTWFSLGNSIVYSQRNVEPAYLVPLVFFKSVDHFVANRNNRNGSNAQMFAAISTRVIPKMHFYATFFVDEVSLRRMFNEQSHTNWFSLNTGVQLSQIVPNTTFTIEYVRTNAMVYKHFIQTTTYANSYYNLGHHLGDNAHQVNVYATYSPLWWMDLEARYQFTEKGPDIVDDRLTINPNTGFLTIQGIDFLENKEWIRSTYEILTRFKPTAHVRGMLGLQYFVYPVPNDLYEIPFYSRNNLTFAFGLSYGF